MAVNRKFRVQAFHLDSGQTKSTCGVTFLTSSPIGVYLPILSEDICCALSVLHSNFSQYPDCGLSNSSLYDGASHVEQLMCPTTSIQLISNLLSLIILWEWSILFHFSIFSFFLSLHGPPGDSILTCSWVSSLKNDVSMQGTSSFSHARRNS